jgi:hypothetical protein
MSDADDAKDWRYLPPRGLAAIGPEDYIRERMFQYRKWYDNKAVQAKFRFQAMRAISVVGAAIVPVLVNVSFRYQTIVTTAISLTVVVFVSLESVFHFGDQWKNYRSTEQFISQEYFYFTSGDGPYRGMKSDRAFLRLVERIESAISAENSSTLNVLTVASKAHDGVQQPTDGAGET